MSAFSMALKKGHVKMFLRPTSLLVNMATADKAENAVNSVDIPLGQYRAEPAREGVEVRGEIIPTSPALQKCRRYDPSYWVTNRSSGEMPER